MSADRELLRRTLAAEAGQPVDPAAATLVDAMLQRHGGAVAAVIYYGSCLRHPDVAATGDSVFDFYVLVDAYRAVYDNPILAAANAMLPPNVFYLEVPAGDRRLRAKYAVLSLTQFRRGVSPAAFHSYFWTRFAQPVRIAHVRDDALRAEVVEGLVDAVITTAVHAAGLMPAEFTPGALWLRVFRETFGAELRAERSDRGRSIYEADAGRFDRLAEPALRAGGLKLRTVAPGGLAVDLPAFARRIGASKWLLRRLVGKLLSMLRLGKGLFTFDGGLDYILWKIERHSGVRARATPWQRRHPLLAAPGLAWKLYRRGGFR